MSSLLPTDAAVCRLLQEHSEMTVSAMAEALNITATAVRQRLTRLMEAGLIDRIAITKGRGRPSHRYSLSAKGRRQAGGNFVDLAMALWEEIRSIPNPEVRRGLLQRVAGRMAASYDLDAATAKERMQAISELFGERSVPISVGEKGELPILTAKCCPYPDLAERDRSVCAMEKMMFSEMVGEKLQLTECRLDGGSCCTFELSST